MEKYNLIPEQLIWEGTISREQLFEPKEIDEEIILRTHSSEYWQKLKNNTLSPAEIRKTGFPLSPELIHRERVICQGTLDAARFARQHGVSLNVSGGTHHAGIATGEGFCLMNDIALAAHELLHCGEARQILIVDLDVHQGNGTAEIFRENPRVFTFSMHCDHNYPLVKEQSSLDIPLQPQTEDATFLNLLKEHLPRLLREVNPDFVFYLSGVDVLASDKLGKMAMTREGCKERDRIVFSLVKAAGVPIAAAMGGGYSPDIRDIVEAHCNTFRVANALFP